METLLSVIAGCAATIIAIIGGFITTKLISINSEREEIDIKLKNILEEKNLRNREVNKLIEQQIEMETLLIIGYDFGAFVAGEDWLSLEEAYAKYPSKYSVEQIRPYWEKAAKAIKVLRGCYWLNKHAFNDDRVPVEYAKTISKFEYEICRCATPEIEYKVKLDKFNNGDYPKYGSPIDYAPTSPKVSFRTPRHLFNEETIESELSTQASNVKFLGLQQSQLDSRKKGLKTSKSTVVGLLVFLAYTIFSVFMPLITLAFLPITNLKVEIALKIINIAFFMIGFMATSIYLMFLLKGKKD